MPLVVFLNGPPGCGKDFAGEVLAEHLGAYVTKFAKVLKERTHALYGLTATDGRPLPHDAFELTKDVPTEMLFGLTPREAYIGVSEAYMKPAHGVDIFGYLLLGHLFDNPHELIAITDSGFSEEAAPIVRSFGAKNCLLIRIQAPGKTFEGDSRTYIDLDVQTVDIQNHFDLAFSRTLRLLVEDSLLRTK